MTYGCNNDIRIALRKKGMYQWEIAELLGISEPTFVRWMRKEIAEEKKQNILDIINNADSKLNKTFNNDFVKWRPSYLKIKSSVYKNLIKTAHNKGITLSMLISDILNNLEE